MARTTRSYPRALHGTCEACQQERELHVLHAQGPDPTDWQLCAECDTPAPTHGPLLDPPACLECGDPRDERCGFYCAPCFKDYEDERASRNDNSEVG